MTAASPSLRDEDVFERRRHRPDARHRRRPRRASCVVERAAASVGAPVACARARARRTSARSATPGSRFEHVARAGDDRRAITSKSVPGSAARSAAGVSSASSRPSCSSATREQRSASSRYGVDMTIVMPCDRNSESSFQNSRRETGSTPVVGSSSRISSRLVDERAGERELLLHAAGQLVGEPARGTA